MKYQKLHPIEWLLCLMAPEIPTVFIILWIDPTEIAPWVLGLPIGLFVGFWCVVAYALVNGRCHPVVLIALSPFLFSALSGLVGFGCALLSGTSWNWAVPLVAFPLALLGLAGGCAISLSQLIRLWTHRRSSRLSTEYGEQSEAAECSRRPIIRDAIMPGESRTRLRMNTGGVYPSRSHETKEESEEGE